MHDVIESIQVSRYLLLYFLRTISERNQINDRRYSPLWRPNQYDTIVYNIINTFLYDCDYTIITLVFNASNFFEKMFFSII